MDRARPFRQGKRKQGAGKKSANRLKGCLTMENPGRQACHKTTRTEKNNSRRSRDGLYTRRFLGEGGGDNMFSKPLTCKKGSGEKGNYILPLNLFDRKGVPGNSSSSGLCSCKPRQLAKPKNPTQTPLQPPPNNDFVFKKLRTQEELPRKREGNSVRCLSSVKKRSQFDA